MVIAIGVISSQDFPCSLAENVRLLGNTLVDDGTHPHFGTHSFTLPLRSGQYTEVVCPLNHAATALILWGKAVSKKAHKGGDCITWVLATEDFLEVEEKFGRSAIKGHHTGPDGSYFKWKHMGFNKISDSRKLPFSIQWLTADNPAKDGKAVASIEKITIAETDNLSRS